MKQLCLNRKIAFEQVYEKYRKPVFGYILSKINNYEDAEDLTADVFTYFLQKYESYDPQKSKESTWLYLIAACRVRNYYRDHKIMDDLSELDNVLAGCGEDELERTVYLESIRKSLADGLEQLQERERRAVILRYFYDQPYRQIAEALHLPEGHVRVMVSRALGKLKKTCKTMEIE